MKKYNSVKNVLSIILALFLLFAIVLVPASAENSTEQPSDKVQEIITAIQSLPNSDKEVTIEHKDAFVKIKNLLGEIDKREKSKIGAENLTKFNSLYPAFEPILIGYLTESMENLPKKIKEKDMPEVRKLYAEYMALSDELKECVNPECVKKVEKAIKKFGADESGASSDADKKQNSGLSQSFFKIYGLAIIGLVSLLVLANIVLVVIVVIKISIYKKRTQI